MTASSRRSRIVLITRRTPLEILLAHHGTHAQARFYLESRGQEMSAHEEAHARLTDGFASVESAIPQDQRRTRVDREQLDRFLFAPDDVVLVVGQDGLVANAAKYLRGQVAAGINPDPERYDGVLCPHAPRAVPSLLGFMESREGPFRIERRTMVLAEREDGQRLLALNEVFVGHRTHQSARYRIRADERQERHSSSGVICATGTGATGWALSISRERGQKEGLPTPEERRLAWFAREPFPSVATGTGLDSGSLALGQVLELASEMGDEGVIFADGIETDRVEFLSGHTVRLGIAQESLNLVMPSKAAERGGEVKKKRAKGKRKR